MRLFVFPFVLLTILVAAAKRACNNSPSLCAIAYDRITYLGAHNSPFHRDFSTGFSTFGNQFFDTTVQLNAGVRLLTAQVHASTDPVSQTRQLRLCRTSCTFMAAGSLFDWLWTIRSWLDRNPDEVVTLILVNYHFVNAREIQADFSKADIAHYGYVPHSMTTPPRPSSQSNNTWPTLAKMIGKGERFVTFINKLIPDQENAPYLLDGFDVVWENAYDVASPTEFACTPNRPFNTTTIGEAHASGKLFFMNHLLYKHQAFKIIIPDIGSIENTNSWDAPGGLGAHLTKCAKEVARQPTFVLIDYFNVGYDIRSVVIFNKVEKPVGRKDVSAEVLEGGSGLKRTSGCRGKVPAVQLALAIAIGIAVFVY